MNEKKPTMISPKKCRKECEVCGKSFEFELSVSDEFARAVLFRTRKTCSKKCEEKYYETELRCVVCGKGFVVDRREEKNTDSWERCCSEECEKKQIEKKVNQAEIKLEEEKQVVIKNLIPPKYRTLETENQQLLRSIKGSCFITGKVGTGKTVLMGSLLKNKIKTLKVTASGMGSIETLQIFYPKVRCCCWISYSEFIMLLQANYEEAHEKAEKVAGFEGVLFIDDLGAEKLTDYVRQITYYIINYREQNELETVITSNFSLAEIDEQIDSRVGSRIAGMCRIIKMDGNDKRLQKKA